MFHGSEVHLIYAKFNKTIYNILAYDTIGYNIPAYDTIGYNMIISIWGSLFQSGAVHLQYNTIWYNMM